MNELLNITKFEAATNMFLFISFSLPSFSLLPSSVIIASALHSTTYSFASSTILILDLAQIGRYTHTLYLTCSFFCSAETPA